MPFGFGGQSASARLVRRVLAPVNTAAPVTSGIAQQGQVLTCSAGSWTNAPMSFTYQWKRDGAAIGGSINAGRTLTLADVGHALSCTVTATNIGGSTAATSADSASVIAAAMPVPVNSVAPVIAGGTTTGSLLSSTTGTWSNSPTGYAYQWRRDGVDIAGATGPTYTLVTADATCAITCRVLATNTGGTAGATSNTITASVPAPGNTVAPAISGIVQDGQILSATSGTWTGSPTSFAYQWNRDGVPVSSATAATRTLTSADVGHVMSCSVTATNAGGSTAATSGNSASVIMAAPANSVAPAITGTASLGSVLSSATGTWTNSPTSYAYQWRRDGVDIGGATASSYTLVSADAGTSITCRVFATNAGGTAGATSNAIALVAAPVNSVAPAVTGSTTPGSVLSSTNGTWSNSPSGYSYQWRRDGTNIAGATAATYTLADLDVTHAVTCRVTATNAGGSTGAVSNTVTATALLASIDTLGWTGQWASGTPPTFTPDTAPQTFSVTRAGYTATAGSGDTSTTTAPVETRTFTQRVRQPAPNDGTLTASTVANDDYVYSTDTIAGVTNNSTETSPKPIAKWRLAPRRLVDSALNQLDVALSAEHRDGIAGVVFSVTDGTTTLKRAVVTPVVAARARAIRARCSNINTRSTPRPSTAGC